ncbi:osmolarity sensor protein EnvZ [Leptotrichia sp. OH3620_COT-345]|uniref:osmolarity sensor protein EnvZ n=1 Tax=Leptotrichia sp. OH3620_COT-345 TaxID=2491048 RepID=UPI000F652D4C|nr:osmolarity sensor protein EnvZ [Leptotrichia sp. OH3620_COT-345]RRD39036.1 osmolarity sensor protein EnvZ [Leptotrichia sp. OH3620_COT-345]
MLISVPIYKEKKKENFRMIIIPTGFDEVGIRRCKDYSIISYLDKNEVEKIGELVLWALEQSSEEIIKNSSKISIEKQYSNSNSYRKFSTEYNLISLDFYKNIYSLELRRKDGAGFGPFEDENSEYEFGEKKPTAYELGSKLMEMFEYKENYDEI